MARDKEPLEAMDEEALEGDCASDAELLPSSRSARRTKPSALHSVAIGAVCIFGMVSLTALVAFSDFTPRGHSARAVAQPLTVRSLLEGNELTELATDNIMAIGTPTTADGKPMDRTEVKAKVSESLQKLSSLIKAKNPEAAARMANLTLTAEQKEKAMSILHKLGDKRMINLTKTVKQVVEEHTKEGGDQSALAQKLQRRLLAHMADISSLAEDLFPGSDSHSIDVPINKGGWHGDVQVDFGRRLRDSDVETVDGVTTQARLMLKSLESTLGDAMPKAPGRILFSLTDDTFTTASTAGYGAQPAGPTPAKTGFMDCLMQAVPNPMKVGECIASNMGSVMSMMKDFMTSKTGGSTGSTGATGGSSLFR